MSETKAGQGALPLDPIKGEHFKTVLRIGVWGLRPQRVEGSALGFLVLRPAGKAQATVAASDQTGSCAALSPSTLTT